RTSLAAAAFFSITAPAPTASYTLSLHDALPIFALTRWKADQVDQPIRTTFGPGPRRRSAVWRGLLLTLGLFVVGVVLWNVGNVGAGAILIILSLLLGGVMAYGLMT